ncbi:MAG: type II/IV secretion system protein [Chloroflexota bacterium]|nr:MAG: type II/IV secretion system protein [Chloroflexota bacterium]
MDTKVRQMEISPELNTHVKKYLAQLKYEVTEGVKLLGKSGVQQSFDMLGRRDDGITNHTVAVSLVAGGDKEAEAGIIFSFANKAYDCGILDRMLIAIPDLSPEAKQLAQKQRIKVIDGERIEQVLTLKTDLPVKPEEPAKVETIADLVKSLANRGYAVREKAKIKGRSGVEYTFDILAETEDDKVGHRLAIDFLNSDKEINLDQLMLFDTKAFEVGVDEKVIVVSVDLSPKAEQFAQHQKIRVLKLGQKLPVKPGAREVPTPASQKPVKTEKAGKLLRQQPQPEALQLIPEVMARRYNVIPVAISGRTLEVAMVDPTDIFALEALAAQSRMRIKPIAASAKDVRDAIDFNYKGFSEIEAQVSQISFPDEATDEKLAIKAATDTPLVQALNLIIDEAVKARASDVHIEPEEDRVRVRYRIDGTLQDTMSLPLNVHRALISRIKILAELNIADHFRPQDGQFSTTSKGREIDIRVATAPAVLGETATLRLLDKSLATLGLSELGLLPDSLAKFEDMLRVPYGMILVSGPTGAGKTTTLYASINSLDTHGRNVITIEDPAEYRFSDIVQIQVNPQAGITFASGLRSILRLDPDVILVGEIRDAETANIATQAALTGHMMLSSIHANDSAGVLSRLVDLKVEPFLIASSVIGVIAQRMVRRVCPDCGRLIEVPSAEQIAYEKETGDKKAEFIYGTGCKSCAYTGYLGRTGIFEIIPVSDAIGAMVCNRASSAAIREQALKDGMISMMSDGMRKVKEGITTPFEVLRNAYSTT